MKTHQRIVFGNMPGGPKQEKILGPNDDPDYIFNTMVFEIAANWSFVQELMEKFHNKSIKGVDPLERDWLNFVLNNHIELHTYEDADQFTEAWFKNKEIENDESTGDSSHIESN